MVSHAYIARRILYLSTNLQDKHVVYDAILPDLNFVASLAGSIWNE